MTDKLTGRLSGFRGYSAYEIAVQEGFVLFLYNCFGSSGSPMVLYNFRIICSSALKNVLGNLIEITLNL